ncbi:hypothetical protein GCM10008018_13930 [Paenibacillus marchantiophytorum]|uniref:Uncharacterized protein n=1 Tax=Paenibacillus marchantiophytorum TaxID=1619310 RepID=A0ABQ2BRD1_9BACL|nr:heparinase II/III family protein [Paenibacillus marchantiophytorum]GGI45799.1 hypothetical protein GCM10008018_13930 [Paenibacillus marchantiophytorum]
MKHATSLKKKVFIPIVLYLLCFSQLLFPLVSSTPLAQAAANGASNVTDEAFFGVWNGTNRTWSTPGKLKYAGFPGLSPVESNVKSGNYAQAQTELLNYFKNRSAPTAPTNFGANANLVPILMDQIITPLKEYYLTTFTVADKPSKYSTNMLSTVKGAVGSKLTYMLMGRHKGANRANIYSREQDCSQTAIAQCRPTLSVQYTSGSTVQTADLTPIKDTFIRGNDTTIHAGETLLQVQESGSPYDSDTRKAYLTFDLASIKGTVTAASLHLSGNTQSSGSVDLMIYQSGDTAWNENTITYANHAGKTFSWQGLSSGTDWKGPGVNTAESEYRYQITRFHWLEPLIAQYQATRTETYAAKYIDYMLDFIRDADSYGGARGSASFPRSFDASIRIGNWIKAYQALKGSPSMNASASTDILKTIWKTADYLNTPEAFRDGHNFGMAQTNSMYNIVKYYPEFADADVWYSTANVRMNQLATSSIRSDGSYIESTSSYALSMANNFLEFKQTAIADGITLSAEFDNKIRSLAKYMADLSNPSVSLPNFGDGRYNSSREFLKRAASGYNDQTFLYIGTSGAQGTPPSYTSVLYPESKLAVMRSGWLPNDRYLFMNLKQDAAHRHTDDNAIDYYAYGRRLLVDPGTYTYTSNPISNWLRYSAESHNTIEFNDATPNITEAALQMWTDNKKFNFLEGITRNTAGFKHYRDVLFLKSSYSIVSDYVQAPTKVNKFQQTWHFLPSANPTKKPITNKVTTTFNDTNGNIQVVPADPGQLVATLDNGYFSDVQYSVTDAT